MKKEIINKLDLQETDHQFGRTFINGVKTYITKDNIFIAECDTLGDKTPGKFIVFKDNNYYFITEQFILNCTKEAIKQILKHKKLRIID